MIRRLLLPKQDRKFSKNLSESSIIDYLSNIPVVVIVTISDFAD